MLKGGKAGKFTLVFRRTPKMINASQCLQPAVTEAPILIKFDPNKPICLETDSSRFDVAGIISS